VEFEWDKDFDHEGFRRTLGQLSEESPSPAGLLSRITGIDASGARESMGTVAPRCGCGCACAGNDGRAPSTGNDH
jgi:hypothetical protein